MICLFSTAIDQAKQGTDLSAEQTSDLIDAMLDGKAKEEQVAELLLALKRKGESVNELVGAAQAMRRHMTPIAHRHTILLDTCGTGGSGSGTFNISTAVAIVAAAAGVAVAKHGNRKASSKTGSADVLEVLGVPIESDASAVAERLDEDSICFCFAAKLHPAMKHVVGVRRKLGVKTLFNLLGPLCNPAGATHQLLGTPTPQTQAMVADAIRQLGTTRSFVVHAEDGQDEVSLSSTTKVVDVKPNQIVQYDWEPADFGLNAVTSDSLLAADPAESAKIICNLFDGQPGPCRDTVVAGTAAALMLVEKCNTLSDAVRLARETIDSGAARNKLDSLRK
ncbi:Anthranilate phosphoribosyltransferase [Novipirellula aureliae]|uniref:Anthranilate phosphoribosyltransferase n=1 Tax=Novipirellula aureliae TaxID=2527966 RepID=A0A5C6DRE8_9BACT|nr:anthranilate phosphoribosyltransferase [Novipirellula aureliae]TWU38774.1 Anthranilate phosphoribosyltransferase [Novipirellula aureliae]